MKNFKNIKLMLIGLLAMVGMNAFADDYVYADNLVYKVLDAGKKTVSFYGVSEKAKDENVKVEINVPDEIDASAPGTGATTHYAVEGIEVKWADKKEPGKDWGTVNVTTTAKIIRFLMPLKTDAYKGEAWYVVAGGNFTQLEEFVIGDMRLQETLGKLNAAHAGTLKILNIYGVSNDRDPVTLEDDFAKGFTALEEVVLPEVEVNIGKDAFSGCTALLSVTMPEEFTNIGDGAFFKSSALEDIDLSYTKTIGAQAFKQSGLTSVEIGPFVTSIGDEAFLKLANAETIAFNSEKMENVPNVFGGCSAVTKVSVESSSVTTIDPWAFYDAQAVEEIDLGEATALETIGEKAFYKTLSALKKVDLSGTQLTSIEGIDILNCAASLTKFHFPGTLLDPMPVFTNYSKLSDINNIPALITVIPDFAFQGTAISKLGFDNDSELETIGESAFEDCSQLSTVAWSMVPELTNMGTSAFKNCVKLTKVELNETKVTSIPDNAFKMTYDLWKDGKQVVENGINRKNTVLASVTLNPKTTTIGNDAFAGCSKLATANLDELTDIQTLGNGAFAATIIPAVDFTNANKQVGGKYVFTTIGNAAFVDNTALTTVTLAPGTKNIGASAFAFYGVDKKGETLGQLATITGLDGRIETIGENAFWGFVKSGELDLTGCDNEKFTVIAPGAFGMNKNMTAVKFPVQISKIGAQAIVNATKLTSVNLNQTCITELPNIFTFDYNSKEVSIDGLKLIELKKDPAKKTAKGDPLPELETIGEYAFQFTGLTIIEIPESVTSFGEDLKTTTVDEYSDGYDDNGRVFQGCVNLTTFTWKNAKVSTMPFYTFRGDVKLTEVYFMTTETAGIIYDEIFFMCNNTKVYVTKDSKAITEANGYGNNNRKYSQLVDKDNVVWKFTEKNYNAADEYYYATYYSDENSSWFPEDKFEVFAAEIEGSKVVLKPATAEGGFYKIPKFNFKYTDSNSNGKYDAGEPIVSSNQSKAICVVRSKDIAAVPQLNSNDGSEYLSTMPAVNHLQYCFFDGMVSGSKINYVFKLGRKSDKIAFYRITSGEFKAGSVFIDAEAFAARTGSLDIFVEGESTGINGIVEKNIESNNAAIFNLQGVRVNGTKSGNLYIKNGKKFIK